MYTIYKLSRTIAGATLSRLPDFFSARFIYRLFLVMTDVTNLMLLNVLVIIREITGGPGRLLSNNLVLFLIRFGSWGA